MKAHISLIAIALFCAQVEARTTEAGSTLAGIDNEGQACSLQIQSWHVAVPALRPNDIVAEVRTSYQEADESSIVAKGSPTPDALYGRNEQGAQIAVSLGADPREPGQIRSFIFQSVKAGQLFQRRCAVRRSL